MCDIVFFVTMCDMSVFATEVRVTKKWLAGRGGRAGGGAFGLCEAAYERPTNAPGMRMGQNLRFGEIGSPEHSQPKCGFECVSGRTPIPEARCVFLPVFGEYFCCSERPFAGRHD